MHEATSPSLRRTFMREIGARQSALAAPADGAIVHAEDLERLPESARRYFVFMGVVGGPRDRAIRVHFTGRFRRKPGSFTPCEAWQYTSGVDVSRVFHMRLRYAGFVPLLARDTYIDGRGRMLGRLGDLVTVVDAEGPELDTGELVTYLNDAILYAPGLLLGPEAHFAAVDAARFDVTFTDRGRSVTARVSVGEDGAPQEFSTFDRYYQPTFKSPMQRTQWTTPVEAIVSVHGRRFVSRARAVWQLGTGPFCYAEFALDPSSLVLLPWTEIER